MILGVGIDLIEIERIKQVLVRHGDRFLQRILRASEIDYCRKHRLPELPIAARFSAKEAIAKAFGTGIGRQLSWLDMEIARRESGEPYVVLHDAGRALFEQRRAQSLSISLSHTAQYATAIAVLAD